MKKILHKLLNCPTFWALRPRFKCPCCGKTYRCYWDGNDIEGVGKDFCGTCTPVIEMFQIMGKKTTGPKTLNDPFEASLTTKITGRRASVLIMDDVIKGPLTLNDPYKPELARHIQKQLGSFYEETLP